MPRLLTFLFLIFFSLNTLAKDLEVDNGQPQNVESVTIMASSSITVPIALVSKLYARKQAVDVNAVFESAPELLRKIDEGDPADIVITASKEQMDNMQNRGLIDPSSRVVLAKNRISLVAAKVFKIEYKDKTLEELLDFIHSRTLMIIADPNYVSLGQFSVEMLKNVGKWNKFRKFIVLAPTSSKTADLIIKSETAGIVYTTDALLYKDQLNHLGMIPQRLHLPIEYHAALVVGNNMEEARDYLSFLSSDETKNILRSNGFVVQ